MEKIIYPVRINRYLALKNICSRREADDLIRRKIVKVNGRIAKLGHKVAEKDLVEVDIKNKNKVKQYVYYAYNKPIGIVTHSPLKGQREIRKVAQFPKDAVPVGRLDKDSHGLIILSNDGRITDKLLNPEQEHEKEYLVQVDKPITNIFLKIMRQGVQLEDFRTKPCQAEKISEREFRLILKEGKKHQIRRMCANLGFGVTDLKRIRVINITLDRLPAGQQREIIGPELAEFLKALKI